MSKTDLKCSEFLIVGTEHTVRSWDTCILCWILYSDSAIQLKKENIAIKDLVSKLVWTFVAWCSVCVSSAIIFHSVHWQRQISIGLTSVCSAISQWKLSIKSQSAKETYSQSCKLELCFIFEYALRVDLELSEHDIGCLKCVIIYPKCLNNKLWNVMNSKWQINV